MTTTHESITHGNEDLAVGLRNTAQALLAKVQPEVQSGPKVRKVTLQVGPDRLLQIAQREIPEWEGGDLWIRERTTSEDPDLPGRRFSELQMPRGGNITTGDIVFRHQPPDVEDTIETLRKELSAGVPVSNKLFYAPIETTRRPGPARELVRQRFTSGANVLRSRLRTA